LTITPQGETFYSFDGSAQESPPIEITMTAAAAAVAAAAAAPDSLLQRASGALGSWAAQSGSLILQQQQRQQQAALSAHSSAAATPTAAAAARALFMSDGVEAAPAFMAARRHSDMLHPANVTTPGDAMTAGDVSLGSWLHLMQGAASGHAAAAVDAAANAAAAAEQAQLLGLGIAAATSPVSFGFSAAPDSPVGLLQLQQRQVALSSSPTYGYSGSSPAAAAAAAGSLIDNAQLYPPPLALQQQQQQQQLDFPAQNVAASPTFGDAATPPAVAAAAGLLSNMQLLPQPQSLAPPSQQQQQQCEMMFELEADMWSSIAESGRWCSVARMSGAELQAQVQQHSPRMAMRVRGTQQQLDMVRDLLQLLLQQHQHHVTHQQHH
jgi:hypothetical protein